MKELIKVEVAYALADQQYLLTIEVKQYTTVKQAVICSRILDLFPNINLEQQSVGIFGQACNLHTYVQAGDRIEIYRPLAIDREEGRCKRINKKM